MRNLSNVDSLQEKLKKQKNSKLKLLGKELPLDRFIEFNSVEDIRRQIRDMFNSMKGE